MSYDMHVVVQTINMINDNPEIGGAEFYMRRGNNPNKQIGSLNSGSTSNCDVRNDQPRASTCCVSGS